MDKFLGISQKKIEVNVNIEKNENPTKVEDTKVDLPWIEKYRPNNLDEVVYQKDIISSLKRSIFSGKLQHLLFYGPPGTGKTSTIIAAAKEMFGHYYKERILELNASDERGIQVIREKVKVFSQKKLSKINELINGQKVADIQIVILDEADLMTVDAQSALRRIIEDFSKTTRFCIICNYLTKIIDPISSRCAKYMFQPLSKDAQIKKINEILINEKISLEKHSVEYIIDICEGDLRRSINQIQALCTSLLELNGDNKIEGESGGINDQLIGELCGVIPSDRIVSTLSFLLRENLSSLEIFNFSEEFLAQGYDVQHLIKQLNDYIINGEILQFFKNLTEYVLCKMISVLVDFELYCLEGGEDTVELVNLFVKLREVFEVNKSIKK